MESDYYPLPEIFPWISTLFVSEEYRGKRISKKLIDFANEYAKGIGFDKTYIPSVHIGLYEKYGYTYIKDIVNYGGDIDRLYAKELR
jgi:GNAT superfamily N-acetyltransferase